MTNGQLATLGLTVALLLGIACILFHVVRTARLGFQKVRIDTGIFRGFCPKCEYDLAGSSLEDDCCPECGYQLSDKELDQLARIRPALLRARNESVGSSDTTQ